MSDEGGAGVPAWVMTFADLMSLLMCFFVLLLSFSEMDVQKFKQLAGSVKNAFGVQNELKVKDIPKGINVIAREFSPGKPEPTTLNEVRQSTSSKRPYLEVNDAKKNDGIKEDSKAEAQAESFFIRQQLKKEVETGLLDVETHDKFVIIRISEKGSFISASAILKKSFKKALKRVAVVLKKTPGVVKVAGHSDNIPIENDMYLSNWELSAARAAAVTRNLVASGMDPTRLVVYGYGDTRPIVPNKDEVLQGLNRRVELIIVQGQSIDRSKELYKRFVERMWLEKYRVVQTKNHFGLPYRQYKGVRFNSFMKGVQVGLKKHLQMNEIAKQKKMAVANVKVPFGFKQPKATVVAGKRGQVPFADAAKPYVEKIFSPKEMVAKWLGNEALTKPHHEPYRRLQ